jgi:hypothetical protein
VSASPLTHIGFAGFLSKDAVIESAFAGDRGVDVLGDPGSRRRSPVSIPGG